MTREDYKTLIKFELLFKEVNTTIWKYAAADYSSSTNKYKVYLYQEIPSFLLQSYKWAASGEVGDPPFFVPLFVFAASEIESYPIPRLFAEESLIALEALYDD